jgi:uncharacterized protein
MSKKKAEKTGFYSWKTGGLARGCKLCVKGKKLVLFVTGICSQRCYYCPISEKKKDKDVIYANEWQISSDKDIITEAELCKAEGAGITGGDPLCRLERTVKYIRLLKKKFGKKFHIHMYVPLTLVSLKSLKRLHDAGLDEIRAHLILDKRADWKKLALLNDFDWDVGVEVPVIPGRERELREMIDFVRGKVDFLNLNEMEISEINLDEFVSRKLRCKDDQSYAIKGSDSLGKMLLNYAANKGIPCHYCTAKLKDAVQMKNRIKLRAGSVATRFDTITPEGTLIRGAVYTKKSLPGFSYTKRLGRAVTKKDAEALNVIARLVEEITCSGTMLDLGRARIILTKEAVEKHAGKIRAAGLYPAVVEEYPTKDRFIVDLQLL